MFHLGNCYHITNHLVVFCKNVWQDINVVTHLFVENQYIPYWLRNKAKTSYGSINGIICYEKRSYLFKCIIHIKMLWFFFNQLNNFCLFIIKLYNSVAIHIIFFLVIKIIYLSEWLGFCVLIIYKTILTICYKIIFWSACTFSKRLNNVIGITIFL